MPSKIISPLIILDERKAMKFVTIKQCLESLRRRQRGLSQSYSRTWKRSSISTSEKGIRIGGDLECALAAAGVSRLINLTPDTTSQFDTQKSASLKQMFISSAKDAIASKQIEANPITPRLWFANMVLKLSRSLRNLAARLSNGKGNGWKK